MNEQDLINKGWEKVEDLWIHKETMNPKYGGGGYTFKYAVRKQEEFDIIDKTGSYYYPVACRYGYGYKILVTHYKKGSIKPTSHISLTKENAKKICEAWNSGKIYSEEVDVQKYNKVIVLHEKHGDRYFMVPTLKDLEKVSLKIVSERYLEGCWYYGDEKPEEPEISLKQATTMKEGALKNMVTDSWKSYKTNLKYYEESLISEQLLKDAIKDSDGGKALQFLNNRKYNEYEGFEIVECEIY